MLVSLNGPEYYNLIDGATNTMQFLRFFEEAGKSVNLQNERPCLQVGDIIVMDNLSAHHYESGEILEVWLEEMGIELICLPTYSPDLNPIEFCFNKVKTLLNHLGIGEFHELTHTNAKLAVMEAVERITTEDMAGFYEGTSYLKCLTLSFFFFNLVCLFWFVCVKSSFEDDENFGSYSVVGSFPKDFGYGHEDQDELASSDTRPRILLLGLRRSGKSSIQKVVFHKMSPNETLFLESTNKIVKDDISNSSFVQFQIWDFPGQIDFFDPAFDSEVLFEHCGALVFVIDAQDDYMETLGKLHMTVTRAYKVNPDIKFEVFIHKVDGLSDDHKIETQRDIHSRATDELADAGLEGLHLSFYLKSMYDHSIFEAFSKVVQKLVPQLPTLENLLNILISNSGIEKAFLFDVVSKIFVATDSSPVDMQSYELCCDMIDVVIDISCIYGLRDEGDSSAYDMGSSSIIKLNNSTILYLREVNK
ncbi:ras-related GTP-binding protein C-like [Montipora capricornis]|uniref:ras-related GTP-binding protein C-like n=1 Tax=Montipora capricornis TaxID=246305 RepID=UPI0035F2079D